MDEATAAAAAAFAKAHPEGGAALLTRLRGEPQPVPASRPKRARVILDRPAVAEPSEPSVSAVVTEAVTLAPTREAWMLRAVAELTPRFEAINVTVPSLRVSVGWPGGRGSHKNALGQCWMPAAVEDQKPAIFVSPAQHEPTEILNTILHEMVHAAGAYGHHGKYATIARKVGLSAPWAFTPLREPLRAELEALAAKLGPFDHSRVTGSDTSGSAGPAVQSTRMLKVICEEDGYTVRATRKWIDVGLPSCPDGHEMREVDQ